MSSVNEIKAKIAKLFEKSQRVRVSINMTRPKVSVENAEVIIRGVYPNIFRIEEVQPPFACHIIPYSDVLTGRVRIAELEF